MGVSQGLVWHKKLRVRPNGGDVSCVPRLQLTSHTSQHTHLHCPCHHSYCIFLPQSCLAIFILLVLSFMKLQLTSHTASRTSTHTFTPVPGRPSSYHQSCCNIRQQICLAIFMLLVFQLSFVSKTKMFTQTELFLFRLYTPCCCYCWCTEEAAREDQEGRGRLVPSRTLELELEVSTGSCRGSSSTFWTASSSVLGM